MEEQASLNNSIETQRSTTKVVIPCVICGVPSRGLVYGVIACEACKKIFKRNAARGLVS